MTWHDGRGNLSFLTNDQRIAGLVKTWTDTERYLAPKCIDDIDTPEFRKFIEKIEEDELEKSALTALAADAEQEDAEERDHDCLDSIDVDEDVGGDQENIQEQEKAMLEEIPLPGTPLQEQARRQLWLKLPRIARTAIRRMHTQFGHVPNAVLKDLLRAAKCPDEYVQACEHFKCDHCTRTKKLPKQTSKVSMPKPYVFNHSLGIDVNFIKDYGGKEGHVFSSLIFTFFPFYKSNGYF